MTASTDSLTDLSAVMGLEEAGPTEGLVEEHPHGSTTGLAVVMPVYNEARVIGSLVDDLGRELLPLVADLEVIVVDDASTDETPAILDRLACDRPWLTVVHAEQNGGHGRAVVRGLHAARADWIFQLDSDGQFVVADFPLLWERRHDSDLVLGIRANRHDPLHRLVLSRTVRIATSLLAGRRIRDANTPFRLLRRAVWDDLEPLVGPDALAPNIFVTLGAAVRDWRIEHVPVTHLAREHGVSTLRALRLVRFSLRGLAQLVAYRFRLTRAPAAHRVPAGDPA